MGSAPITTAAGAGPRFNRKGTHYAGQEDETAPAAGGRLARLVEGLAMADATASVVPEHEQTAQDNATAAEQAVHAATCGICTIVVHSLFAVAWRGGSPGSRAGEMADCIGRRFCALLRESDPDGDKATPVELHRAARLAIAAYLDSHGAHVRDHTAFQMAVAKTVALALSSAGEVTINGPADTLH